MFKPLTILHGIIIGIANIIPGISGGTLAVVLGIYEELIHSIKQVTTNPFKNLKALSFLLQVGFGALLAIKLSASLIDFLISHYPRPTFMAFIGLILGSIPSIIKQNKNMSPNGLKLTCFIIAFISVLSLNFIPTGTEPSTQLTLTAFTYFYMFISGFIAAATMILPGISGSFILLVMGSYSLVIQSVATLNVPILSVVGLGAIVGIFSTSKAIDYFLKRFPGPSYYAILGLLVASIPLLWPGLDISISSAISILIALISFILVRKLA